MAAGGETRKFMLCGGARKAGGEKKVWAEGTIDGIQ